MGGGAARCRGTAAGRLAETLPARATGSEQPHADEVAAFAEGGAIHAAERVLADSGSQKEIAERRGAFSVLIGGTRGFSPAALPAAARGHESPSPSTPTLLRPCQRRRGAQSCVRRPRPVRLSGLQPTSRVADQGTSLRSLLTWGRTHGLLRGDTIHPVLPTLWRRVPHLHRGTAARFPSRAARRRDLPPRSRRPSFRALTVPRIFRGRRRFRSPRSARPAPRRGSAPWAASGS